ncbi:MAG: Tat pathway signal sequence domain protein, partial [Kiritimatiellaeota bacterium]|nr:Tat pathway signal sequence domain protein [Kiritimatiellota bacterium]
LDDPLLPEWKKILVTLTDYSIGPNGLDIGRGVPLAHSHRHYSHLLMIYPLYQMTWEQPERRALIEKSLDHWIGFKGALQGYTYTGASSICASIGRREQAVSLLNAFLDSYIKPNTMYLEGSPVIETPLSGAQSIQDLLLQSWGGKIRVFPGVPASWKDATFHNLRAEGGFLVSAARKDGKTQWVRVTHPKGGTCLVQLDENGLSMGARGDKWSVQEPQPAVYKLTMGPGAEVWIYAGKASPPMIVCAFPADPANCNFYGVKAAPAKK